MLEGSGIFATQALHCKVSANNLYRKKLCPKIYPLGCRCGKGIFYIVPYQKSTSQPTHRLSHWHNASDPLEWSKSGRVSFPEICQILSAKNRLLTDDPNYIKKKRTKVDPNAPDNEQDQEMNQALVLEVEPALVAEVNEDTSGEQYADECGIPIGSQEFKLMDGSTLF